MLVYLLVLDNVIFGERTDGFCGGSYLLVVIESGTEVLFWNLHLSIPEGFFSWAGHFFQEEKSISCQLAENRLGLGLLGCHCLQSFGS